MARADKIRTCAHALRDAAGATWCIWGKSNRWRLPKCYPLEMQTDPVACAECKRFERQSNAEY